MKLRALALALPLVVSSSMVLAVQPGDTREAVIAELGAPDGSAAVGANTILFFARGQVTLREGRVVTANVVSAEEFAARATAEAESLQRIEEAARARLTRLQTEGRTIHAAKKADANFAALPVADQLSYWRAFATRYPMVPVIDEISALTQRVDQDLRLRERAAAHEVRLAELEARLAETEDRAAFAEREAQRDRYGYGGYAGYYPRRGYHRPHHDRPPVVVTTHTTPPQNRVDAARAEAMAAIESARQRAYAGGGR